MDALYSYWNSSHTAVAAAVTIKVEPGFIQILFAIVKQKREEIILFHLRKVLFKSKNFQ